MSTSRVPAGVPTGGQFAASAHAESGVSLSAPVTVADIAADPQFVDCMARWHATDEPDSLLMDEVADWGQRLLDASEEDRPGRDPLLMAKMSWDDLDEHDLDWAMSIADGIDTITAKSSMRVVEDGRGGHTRLYDNKPGYTCGDCGNGFATAAVLAGHQDRDCAGPPTQEDLDDEARHDTLHSAAESYASEINNAGIAEQVAFLRRHGVSDDEMAAALANYPRHPEHALEDLVIDACSQYASQAYNDGQEDANTVRAALESKRWLLTSDQTPVDKHPVALADGECTHVTYRVPNDDGTAEEITYRVTYREEVPLGDDNTPARNYRRGEFGVESEWAQHEYVVARASSPFRPDRGEKGQMVGYAWEQFDASLRAAARTSARARRLDPLGGYFTR